ncbi:NAD-dependent epimerase/dehydratase family protein [Streptomyces sp. NPDC059104]|uniref:NAD-dependent epimerase/dehydratase family protein n=1 Tax=Streptomyces sp. NPDC059104 TaxID=3346729 RepID=UPI0036D005B6
MKILLTGGSGFVGGHVLRRLARDPGLHVTALVRPSTRPPEGADARVSADLSRPETLDGVCDGMDVVLHCASYVGADPTLCEAVNARGTTVLSRQARAAGVGHMLSMSTAAVYGRGPHHLRTPDEGTPAPVSHTSATRLAGERAVLAAGGVVLRPVFMYGTGDRWFVPGLIRQLRDIPHVLNDGTARLSMISADDLSRVVTAYVRDPRRLPGPAVHHAGHREPVRAGDLITMLASGLGLPLLSPGMSLDEAEDSVGVLTPWASRQLSLTALDHWFHSDALWSALALDPGPTADRDLIRHLPWYRRFVT